MIIPYKTGSWGEQAKARSKKRLEYFREYSRKNGLQEDPEERRKYYAKYYEKNKAKILANNNKYYLQHREQLRRNAQNNYQKNREKILQKMQDYYKQNFQKIKAQDKAYWYIKIPQGQLCELCDEAFATMRHHKDYSKPLEVQFLCASCHRRIHAKRG